MKNDFYRFKMRKSDFGDKVLVPMPPQQFFEDIVDDRNVSAESLGLIMQSTEDSFCEKVFSDLAES